MATKPLDLNAAQAVLLENAIEQLNDTAEALKTLAASLAGLLPEPEKEQARLRRVAEGQGWSLEQERAKLRAEGKVI